MGCCGPSKKDNEVQKNEAEKNLSPIDLLKIRFAKGEIAFEEYQQTKAALEQ
jgi:uncharacterized membrane protein